MSASTWQVCPRCTARAQQPAIEAIQRMTDAYGHVTMDEFEALREQAASITPEPLTPTFRETYSVTGVSDSRIVFIYSGLCSVCGLTVGFNDEHAVTWDQP